MPCTAAKNGHKEQHLPCSWLVFLPTVLTSSEMVIPLTGRVMTLVHYFKCHFCGGINQLSERLDYILILIVLSLLSLAVFFKCIFQFFKLQKGTIPVGLCLTLIFWLGKLNRRAIIQWFWYQSSLYVLLFSCIVCMRDNSKDWAAGAYGQFYFPLVHTERIFSKHKGGIT